MCFLNEIKRLEIRRADSVVVFDPDTDKAITVWGETLVGPSPKIVELACREADTDTFRQILEAIPSVHGCISSQVTDPPRFT